MKAFKLLAFTALLGLSGPVLTSCSEDVLDITPAANNSSDDFYKDEGQLNQAVLSIYNAALSFPQSSHWNISEIRSDNVLIGNLNVQRDYSDISNFTAVSQTGQLQATWTDLYELVFRSNMLLEKIQPFTFARTSQFQGEARFLRALAYFDLVRYWGPVPIADKVLSIEESKKVPRSSVADVYSFIVADLQYAANSLPETYAAADKGRATKWAAKALLGKVYLTMYGYPLKQSSALPLAKQQLSEVLAKEGSAGALATSYADLFKVANDNKFSVFEVQYISGGTGLGSTVPWDQGNNFPITYAPFQPSQIDALPGPDLFGAGWPKADKRKAATVDSITKVGTATLRAQFIKFLEKGTKDPVNNRDYPNNFPIIRFEDVMLMQAEVLNEEAGAGAPVPSAALALVNRIRTRSGVPVLASMTKENFRLALERERRWEFAGEGLRWFDLVRTERALPVMNKFLKDNAVGTGRVLDEHDLLFPIPQQELRINPGFWEQNPGYN
ncbi:RagB/SusD family nutrient uptake outer membrane protein [Hymenobacter chitinivorans]|uniref:Putative outer membrane starch-binding protein n=1 Tax=Hymenobacter chitinivorans DSM 11115 TaxID=1121954 RepID=A0A2M9BPR2_9BACT|nr:RagB/SusD family nutrient uptake outer membrane protein [Hymenobacter chitinivorans]PJJ59939.1 putative outer membrane starch-binding protein [Hymenobacter chitinivorans DSM 11115]